MIKKLIFDLDNTLIMWKDEYVDAIAKSISKFNIKNPYFPAGNIPLNALSAAADKVLSLTYLLFTKNN